MAFRTGEKVYHEEKGTREPAYCNGGEFIMTYQEAYDALNVVERQKISKAVCYDEENPIEGEAAQAFYDELNKLDGGRQYDMMEQMEFELTQKVLEDNPF